MYTQDALFAVYTANSQPYPRVKANHVLAALGEIGLGHFLKLSTIHLYVHTSEESIVNWTSLSSLGLTEACNASISPPSKL